MGLLNIDQIIACDDLRVEKVDTPEWGEGSFVYVRGMTGVELDMFERTNKSPNIRGRLLSWCLCDESGKSLGCSAEQATKLGQKAGNVVDRICDTIFRLSSQSKGSLEQAEGN